MIGNQIDLYFHGGAAAHDRRGADDPVSLFLVVLMGYYIWTSPGVQGARSGMTSRPSGPSEALDPAASARLDLEPVGQAAVPGR